MQILKCDRCGRVFENNTISFQHRAYKGWTEPLDLCDNCLTALDRFMAYTKTDILSDATLNMAWKHDRYCANCKQHNCSIESKGEYLLSKDEDCRYYIEEE